MSDRQRSWGSFLVAAACFLGAIAGLTVALSPARAQVAHTHDPLRTSTVRFRNGPLKFQKQASATTILTLGTSGANTQIRQPNATTTGWTDGTNTLFTFADNGTTGTIGSNRFAAADANSSVQVGTIYYTAGTASNNITDGTNTFVTITDAGTVGSLTVTSSFGFAGSSGSINTVNVASAVLNFKTSFLFKDDGGNTMSTFTDNGTSGIFATAVLRGTSKVQTDAIEPFSAGGNVPINESGGSAMATFTDLGATGSLAVSGDGITSLFGTGTATATAAGTLNVQSTAVGNVGGGTDDLITYTLPANSLVATNRGVRIHAYGSFANNGNGKILTCLWGSTTINQHSPTINVANELWTLDATVIRTGASAQDYNSTYIGDTGAAGAFDFDPEAGTSAQTETSAVVIKCTGAGTADNDIVMDGLVVEAF